MNSQDDLSVRYIPCEMRPIMYKVADENVLSPHILIPGPKLAIESQPNDINQYIDFPSSLSSVSNRLMDVLQFTIAHIAHNERYFMDMEDLIAIQRDLVQRVKRSWETITSSEDPVHALAEEVLEFCITDDRYETYFDFGELLEGTEEIQEDVRMDRLAYVHELEINSSRDPENPPFPIPALANVQHFDEFCRYAEQVLVTIVSSEADLNATERLCDQFRSRLENINRLWSSGWLGEPLYRKYVGDIFSESAVCLCFIDIYREFTRLIFVRTRGIAVDRLSHIIIASPEDGKDIQVCPICLELFSVGDDACVASCRHTFHSKCLLTWMWEQLTCPMDRSSLALPGEDIVP